METVKLGSVGPTVELLQSSLRRVGFFSGSVDGIFGNITFNSVKRFQKDFGLVQDGIVGTETWNALFPYMYGYTSYTIRPSDTLYGIAMRFSSSVPRILTANPRINPDNLIVGSSIIVPFNNIVQTDLSYTYDILKMNISSFSVVFPFVQIGSIGTSVMGNDIPFLRIGTGKKEVFYSSSIHR